MHFLLSCALLFPQVELRHQHAAFAELREFLAIPNEATDPVAVRRNAAWLIQALTRRGLAPRLLEVAGAPPAVFAELPCAGATRTLVFYAHYDGQPVEPERWTGGEPFRPILRSRALEEGGKEIEVPASDRAFDPESRLYARSASDDKGAIVALLAALDQVRERGLALRSHVKLFFEGEEEAGSRHLPQLLKKHQDLLKGDVWLFLDGPVHPTRRPQIVFGARGITGLELTVFGPNRELHSGHYGNWAPNPARILARLLTAMVEDDGKVLIPGFYEDVTPLSTEEQKQLAQAPDIDAELRKELGIGRSEGGGRRLDQLLTLPSLNVRGLAAAGVGPLGRNVIPSTATASLDIRLVRGMDPRKTLDQVEAFVKAQGFHVVEGEPDQATRTAHPRLIRLTRRAGYRAVRTSMDLPVAQEIVAAVEAVRGPVVRLPTLGGSLPLAAFDEVLRVPVVIVPIASHDNHQHGHDENLRLQNLWDGITTFVALLRL